MKVPVKKICFIYSWSDSIVIVMSFRSTSTFLLALNKLQNCLRLLDSRLKEVQIYWLYLLFRSVWSLFCSLRYRCPGIRDVFTMCCYSTSFLAFTKTDYLTINLRLWFSTLTFGINWFILSMNFVIHKEQAAETWWLFCLTRLTNSKFVKASLSNI